MSEDIKLGECWLCHDKYYFTISRKGVNAIKGLQDLKPEEVEENYREVFYKNALGQQIRLSCCATCHDKMDDELASQLFEVNRQYELKQIETFDKEEVKENARKIAEAMSYETWDKELKQ